MNTAGVDDTTTGSCELEVDAVLFDLDGVLVDSTASVERHWRGFAADHGLDADRLLHDLHGRRMIDIVGRALPHLTGEDLASEAARVDAAEAADAHDAVPLPGAIALTAELGRRGIPWAIATSGTRAVAGARLAAAGIPRPPVVVTADDVSAGKPAPDPYLLAAEQLGVSSRRCLVIEDAPSGLRAGGAAGAVTVALTTSHTPDELGAATHRAGTLADLRVSGSGSGGTVLVDCVVPGRHG